MPTVSMPVPFAGSNADRKRNFFSHEWQAVDEEGLECQKCASRSYHAAALYPCGTEPPRQEYELNIRPVGTVLGCLEHGHTVHAWWDIPYKHKVELDTENKDWIVVDGLGEMGEGAGDTDYYCSDCNKQISDDSEDVFYT